MNEMRFKQIKTSISFAVVGIVSILAFAVAAQTAPASSQGNVEGALKDLSMIYGKEISNVTEAKDVCNNEKYISDCAEIGKKHKLFQANEIKQVDAVLSELKGKVAEDLKNCTTEECLVDVATRLAKNLAQKNSSIAKTLDLTTAKVEEKRVVVDAAKEVGVNIQECRSMDPDAAPIELLRACARLAKNQSVQKVLTKETRQAVESADVSLKLREALATGEMQCGDNTPEGCGNYCLNPGTETRANGASAIPQVCRDIATRFFGAEGVKHLEQAYGQVNQTVEFYKKRADNIVFTTLDGRTITDPAKVGKYLEEEGRKGNVEAVEKGMDFMITKGFLKEEDKEFALQVVGKIKTSGTPVDFDQCAKNPEACREFIPDANRREFDAFREIENIMRAELGPRGVADPRQCDSDDPKIGEACLAGAKAALPKIEAIAAKNPQAKFIVQEIKQHIQFGDQGAEARKNIEEKFKGGQGITIGGQQFNNFQQVQQFCEKNGQLCLADAAKEGFIGKDYAAQRFEQSFETQFRNQQGGFPGPGGFPGVPGQFPGGQGGFPGGFPQQGGFQGGQFNQGFPSSSQFQGSGSPTFNKEEALKQFQQWLDNPQGAPPIPNQFGPQGQFGQPGQFPQPGGFGPVCPTLPTVNECPAGQRKVVAYNSPQCGIYYKCESGSTIQPLPCQPDQYWDGRTCVARYGTGQCPPNQYWVNQSGGGGFCRYYENQPSQQCPQDQYWFIPPQGGQGYCKQREVADDRPYCPAGQYWNGTTCAGSTNPPVSSQKQQIWNSLGLQSYIRTDADSARIEQLKQSCVNVPSSSNIWMPNAGNSASSDFGMPDPSKCQRAASCASGQYFDGANCVSSTAPPGGYSSCDSSLIALLGTGCHYMYNDSSGNQIYCNNEMTKSAKRGDSATTAGCASSSTSWPTDQTSCTNKGYKWCTSSSSSGWCQSGACPAGDYPYAGDANSCPGFAYSRWDTAGKRYCQLNSERKCDANYPSYLTNGANYKVENCPADSAGSCPAGQYWYTPPGGGSGYCQSSTTSSSCDSSLIALLGTGCHSMYTDSSGNQVYCDGPMSKSAKRGDTTATSGCASSGGTPSCPSGQWWNGSACTSGGTTSGTCDSTLTGLLGSGCHNMGNAWFNGEMTKYVLPSTTAVKECTSSSISGCTVWSNTCPSGQYWNGSSCVSSATPPSTGSSACSDGQDNDSDGKIDYPADDGCYSSSDPDEIIPAGTPPSSSTCPSFAHEMSGYCMLNNDTSRCASYSNAGTESNYTSAQCGGGTTSGSCPSGQYWNGTACVTSTTTGSCPSGQYWYVPQGSTSGYCTSSTTPPPSSTTCPSGQYWYTPPEGGSGYCKQTSTTDCPSGQYWSGTACVSSTTPPPSSTSCTGGQYLSGSSCVCPSGTSWNGSSCVSACSSGQYWNGTSCVSSTTTPPPTTPPPSTSCASGQYWNGSACVSSCTGDQYWNGSSCVSPTPPPAPPPTTPPPEPTPPPPPPPPPPPTSFFFRSSNCPGNHYWNGSYCVVRPQYTAHLYAQVVTSFKGITEFITGLFR